MLFLLHHIFKGARQLDDWHFTSFNVVYFHDPLVGFLLCKFLGYALESNNNLLFRIRVSLTDLYALLVFRSYDQVDVTPVKAEVSRMTTIHIHFIVLMRSLNHLGNPFYQNCLDLSHLLVDRIGIQLEEQYLVMQNLLDFKGIYPPHRSGCHHLIRFRTRVLKRNWWYHLLPLSLVSLFHLNDIRSLMFVHVVTMVEALFNHAEFWKWCQAGIADRLQRQRVLDHRSQLLRDKVILYRLVPVLNVLPNLNQLRVVLLLLADHIVQSLTHVDVREGNLGLFVSTIFVAFDKIDLLVMAFLQLLNPLLKHEHLGLKLLILITGLEILSISMSQLRP